MPLKSLTELDAALISTAFAGACGSLSFLLKVEEGKPFKWREFFLHTAASAAFGFIAYEALSYESFPPQLAGALCGIAGWGGTRFARIFEVILLKRLGIKKEEIEE